MSSDLLRQEVAGTVQFATQCPVEWHHGVIVYGAGKGGREFGRHAGRRGIPIRFFCDDDPARHGSEIDGKPVYGSAMLGKCPHVPVVIALAEYHGVLGKLRMMGVQHVCFSDDFFVHHVPKDAENSWVSGHFDRAILDSAWQSIHELDRLLSDDTSRQVLRGLLRYRWGRSLADLVMADYPQYAHPVVHAVPGDRVLDGGAWIGDTAEQFARAVGGRGKVFPFEPTPATIQTLVRSMQERGFTGVVEPINAGLGAIDGVARFSTTAADSGSFHITAGGNLEVRITAIDAFCQARGIRPAFIKMDIEGAELDAICGAERTIREQHPKLAICVYHKPRDLWEIPLRLREIHPAYRFYLGQHARGVTETVIYAIHQP